MTTQIFLRRLLLFGAPLALGLVEMFHPPVNGMNLYVEIAAQQQAWLVVHLLQLPLAGLVALAVLELLRTPANVETDESSVTVIAVRASWFGVWLFLVFFSALDALTGIGSGLAVEYARGLPLEQQQAFSALVNEFFYAPIVVVIGRLAMLGWVIAVTCAAIALAQRKAPRLAVAFLAFSLIFAIHVPPTGPLGMLCFFIAVCWLEFRNGRVSPALSQL